MSTQRVAWIGLGNMGRGMARNIVEKADFARPLVIHNRTAKRSHDFAASLKDAASVAVADSIAEAVSRADIVFTSLGDDASVVGTYEEALKAPGGVEGKLFVETSTILPESTDAVAAMVRAAKGEFVANPVFGVPAMAEAGLLVAVLAGPSSAIDRVLPYCDGVRSRAVVPMRDAAPGKASLMKITGNSFILSMVETLAEGHTWAEKSGLGQEALHGFIEVMLGGPYVPYSKRMMEGDYIRDEPLFAVDLALKDAGHAITLANQVGVDLSIAKVAQEHLKQLKSEQGPTGDLPGIYGVLRKNSGLPFANK